LLNIGCVPKYGFVPEYKNLNKYFYLTKGPKYKRERHISLELFCSFVYVRAEEKLPVHIASYCHKRPGLVIVQMAASVLK
jgi:fucose permease